MKIFLMRGNNILNENSGNGKEGNGGQIGTRVAHLLRGQTGKATKSGNIYPELTK